MSEENTQGEDKQAALKEKLKDMGVMPKDSAEPQKKPASSWVSRAIPLVIILLVVVAVILFWPFGGDQQDADLASTQGHPYASYAPPPIGYPPAASSETDSINGQPPAQNGAGRYYPPPYPPPPPVWAPPYYGPYGPPPRVYGYHAPYGPPPGYHYPPPAVFYPPPSIPPGQQQPEQP